MDSLAALLEQQASRSPDLRAYTFLTAKGDEGSTLTCEGLYARALAVAGRLRDEGVRPGDRALLLYPPGSAYLEAFFGCVLAGVVAVPAYPPDPARLDRTLPRLLAIVADAAVEVALTTSAFRRVAGLVMGGVRWVATDGLAAASGSPLSVSSDDVCYLQYTSGSTGDPRGVMVTHRNLLHNMEAIRRGFGMSEESRGVIWLPPYHDMGLIGGLLVPLHVGFPVYLMSPVDFLKHPLRWLQAVSRYRGTISGGPNFAFDLCVRKAAEAPVDVDLSSWTVAFCGAEPVRAETMEAFSERFGPSGFRREAFYPCYGLAESTLMATGGTHEAPPVTLAVDGSALDRHQVVMGGDRVLVGCGRAVKGQTVRIVDPESRVPCAPHAVGEIWLAGPSVARGYWGRASEAFNAYTSDGEGPYLRTGDLGFLRDGELFVTGRCKDLIIVCGRNVYPQDLERTVERSHPAVRPGSCAAFSVAGSEGERVIVAAEVRPGFVGRLLGRLDGLPEAIRRAVAEAHDVQIHEVRLLRRGSIPKTSSGKIRRQACREAFQGGRL